MTRTLITSLALCAALAGACAHDDQVRERASVSAVTNQEATGDEAEPGKTKMHYTKVGDDVALNRAGGEGNDASNEADTLAQGSEATAACQRAVYFDTDSAALDAEAEAQLQTVAGCIKRHDIDHALITGRADPRGTEQHNDKLGMKRAETVAEYLRKLGVPEEDIRVRSQGETAAADSKQLWPADRRASVSVQ